MLEFENPQQEVIPAAPFSDMEKSRPPTENFHYPYLVIGKAKPTKMIITSDNAPAGRIARTSNGAASYCLICKAALCLHSAISVSVFCTDMSAGIKIHKCIIQEITDAL